MGWPGSARDGWGPNLGLGAPAPPGAPQTDTVVLPPFWATCHGASFLGTEPCVAALDRVPAGGGQRMLLVPEAPGAAGRQASGHRMSSLLQPGPQPRPALALSSHPRPRLSPSRSWQPFLLGGQTSGPDWPGSGHVPSGALGWWGRVGEPPSLSFPDCTVRETVILSLIQTRPLTGCRGGCG